MFAILVKMRGNKLRLQVQHVEQGLTTSHFLEGIETPLSRVHRTAIARLANPERIKHSWNLLLRIVHEIA